MSVSSAVDRLLAETSPETLTAVRVLPAAPAHYGEWPEGLRPELKRLFQERGLERLYSHQAEAVRLLLEGRHTVVVTPTASGKTLCYNLPVLQTILCDDTARALYLFPTKALAQDQLAELHGCAEALGREIRVFTYDGDTPGDARRQIRARAHVALTNPDMLHAGILPHHTRWARFLANLRYVVLDELHTYRGVFGSHLANVLRRLRRLCAFHGSDPIFCLCSATIANPGELARRLLEAEVTVVDRNGAPRGEKTLLFYNPPVLNRQLGIRRSYLTAARGIASRFLEAGVQTILFASSRLNVEVLTRYLKERFERRPGQEGRVEGYRGGYLPGARRAIERGLREGRVRGVVSTNALELGIDVGALQAAVLAGYPGTVASTWQQIGRAGRRREASAAVLVARSDPLDQFIVEHPDYFFGSSPEHALINPDNPAILVSHLKCAAFELPFREGERFGTAEVREILEYLAEKGVLHRSGDEYHWTQEVYPADQVSLRSPSEENFVIMDLDDGHRVIAEVDFPSAPTTVYPDAIYMAHARTYHVKHLDYEQRRAYVRRVQVDYYTEAITSTAVRVLERFEAEDRGAFCRAYGEVHVCWRVSGFKKIRFATRENVGYGEVKLPDQEMHTTSFWLTLSDELCASLGYPRCDILDGVVGLAYCFHHLAPFFLMCDTRDLGRSVGDREGRWSALPEGSAQGRYRLVPSREGGLPALPSSRTRRPPSEPLERLERFEPTVFLYESCPGGVGLSPQLYDLFDELAGRAGERLRACPCESGCPSCVGPPQEVGDRAREVALRLLDVLVSPVAMAR